MTAKQLLQNCVDSFLEIRKIADSLSSPPLEISPDSEVLGAMWNTHDKLVALTVEILDDKDKWIDWYLWENEAGKRKFEAKAASWPHQRQIKNLDDLIDLING